MEKQIIDIDFGDNIICIGQIRKDLDHDLQVAILEHIGDGLWDFDEELELVISTSEVDMWKNELKEFLKNYTLWKKIN